MVFEAQKSRHVTSLGRLGGDQKSIQGVLDAGDRVHLFKFKLANRSSQSFQIQGLQQDADLRLLNRRGTLLHKSKQPGRKDESIATTLTKGTYYLKVRLTGEGSTDYTLTTAPTATSSRQQAALGYVKGDGVNAEERKLYRMINRYREKHGAPKIKFSKALSIVANRHVIDLHENVGYVSHNWSSAAGHPSDPTKAPQTLGTGYRGRGYENIFGARRFYTATAKDAFHLWKNSTSHNDTMLSKGVWRGITWKAMGVGIYKGFAAVWFGEKTDPTGQPEIE